VAQQCINLADNNLSNIQGLYISFFIATRLKGTDARERFAKFKSLLMSCNPDEMINSVLIKLIMMD
jgi:hypothetical protein